MRGDPGVGGSTDIANGFLPCTHHHTLIHEGEFAVDGESNGTLTFLRPNGRALGASSPINRRAQPV